MFEISIIDFLLMGLLSWTLVVLSTPIMLLVARRFGIIDHPVESHKTHLTPTPYLGGMAIMFGTTFVTLSIAAFSNYTKDTFFLAATILAPAIALGIVGLIDDIKKLQPMPRFVVQTIFGLGISLFLVKNQILGSPFGNNWIDIPLTLIWIVGITNAINFFDNIDGGANGVVFIASLFLFFLSIQGEQILIAALSIVIAGATLGFLFWNKPPARIYMGDAGALFLGLLMATLTTRFNPSPIDRFASFSIPLLLLAVPILDTSIAVVSRLRRGASPFQGGRDHLSHRLLMMSFSKRQTVLILWLLCFFFCTAAVVISFASYEIERLLAFASLGVWTTCFFFFIRAKDTSETYYVK